MKRFRVTQHVTPTGGRLWYVLDPNGDFVRCWGAWANAMDNANRLAVAFGYAQHGIRFTTVPVPTSGVTAPTSGT
jgi:hypothetical protein